MFWNTPQSDRNVTSGVAETGDADGKTRSSDTQRSNKTQEKLIDKVHKGQPQNNKNK